MNKERKNVFEKELPIRNKTAHEWILGVLIFIVVPIINCFIIGAGKESALYNSLSRLAWPEGLLWLVYVWGLLNMGCFLYATILSLRAGGYSKGWRKLIIALDITFIVILTIGVAFPHTSIEAKLI